MYINKCFEPKTPEFLNQSWLRVMYKNQIYIPYLFRLRKQSFSADAVRSFNPKGYGHYHKIYHFVYYLKGSNTILVNDKKIKVRSDQMILIDPDVYHDVIPQESADCSFITLMIVYRIPDSELDNLDIPFSRLLGILTGRGIESEFIIEDSTGNLRIIFAHLEKHILENTNSRQEHTGYCLMALLNEISGLQLSPIRECQIPDDILTIRQYLFMAPV